MSATGASNHSPVSRRAFLAASAAAGAMPNPMLLSASATERPVRVGVVGGRFGLNFFWSEHPNSSVTAVCDVREDRLHALSERFQCDTQYRNFHDLIADSNVDAVAVFTPAPLHAYMCVEAMKAGKHVITAVPAACSLAECEEVIEVAEQTGMNYMMAETSYYRYEVIQCRKWATEGAFGTIIHSESEYHHEGLLPLMYDERGLPTWRHGFPPMLYITHNTGIIIPVTGERLVEVTCTGWGDDHEVLRTNLYGNPFWNETAHFKTEKGRTAQIAIYWRVAGGVTERGGFWGTKMSYQMPRPGGVPGLVSHPAPDIRVEPFDPPDFWEEDGLPEPIRRHTAHGGAHPWITHEFIRSIVEERRPEIDVYEAVAYTAPGFYAHESALRGGETLKIKDFGRAKRQG